MTTRQEEIEAAGMILAVGRNKRDSLGPREAAEAAWYPGHRLKTVDAIEALIIRQRERAAEIACRKAELVAHQAAA